MRRHLLRESSTPRPRDRPVNAALGAGWLLLGLICAAPATLPAQAGGLPPRDRAYWEAVIATGFAVPGDVPLPVLLDDLSTLLGSSDPNLRDDIAYTILTRWILTNRVVPVHDRLRLLDAWQANLRTGIGAPAAESVALRSFSALGMVLLVMLDDRDPYLAPERFAALLAATVDYLGEEVDVRGFDPRLGWLHSVAHTADLLRVLGGSRHLTVPDQGTMLRAIADKLAAVPTPLVHGEDERLARAVQALVIRPDFNQAAFATWLESMAPIRRTTGPSLEVLAIDQNRKNLLVTLHAVLSTDRSGRPSVAPARDLVLGALRRFL